MDLFLKILSGIGLTLLIILIVILSILLLVLFVPVRYGGSGSFKDNKLSFSARASWLLGLVSVKFLFGDDDPLRIKVLFFRLNKKDKKPKKEKIKKEKRKKDKAKKKKSEEFAPFDETDSKENTIVNSAPCENVSDEAVNESGNYAETGTATGTESSVVTVTEEVSLDHIEEPADAFSDLIPENIDSLKEKSKNKNKKKKKIKTNSDTNKRSIYDKIKKYLEIIESKRFKRAYAFCKEKIKRLLKCVCPRKWELNAVVGFDDPSTTGNILCYTSMLYPFIAKHIHICGDFENERIEADLKFKGHITAFRILWIGVTVYFNKDIRKLIKMFKEV